MRNEINNKDEILSYLEDEIDLRNFIPPLIDNKWKILSITIISAIITAFFVFSLPNYYRAEAVLSLSSSNKAGNLGAFGSLLNGHTLHQDKNLNIALEVLKTRSFIHFFLKKYNLYPEILAAKSWDEKNQEIVFDQSIYDSLKNIWYLENGSVTKEVPSNKLAKDAFLDSLRISISEEKEVFSISFQHVSPILAKQVVELLIIELNEYIRNDIINRSNFKIQEVYELLNDSYTKNEQSVLLTLIEQENKKILLAKTDPEYIFKTIDPAVIPEIKDGPKRFIIILLGSALACFLTMVIYIIRYIIKTSGEFYVID